MNPTFVILKAADTSSQTEFDLASHLVTGQSITAASLNSPTPVTSPVLTGSVSYSGSTVAVLMTGGLTDTTYNVRLTVTTASPVETKLFTLAVSVRDSQYASFQTKNPMAFQRLVDQIDAGESAIGAGTFPLRPGTNVSNAVVRWTLMDNEGVTYAQGNAYDYQIIDASLAKRLTAFGLINVPSNVEPSTVEHTYMIRWELTGVSTEPIYAFEGVKVLGRTTTPQGAGEVIELKGDPAVVSLILPELYENVALEIYRRNDKLTGPVSVPLLERTNDGHYYAASIDTSSLNPDLEAYNVVWSYRNSNTTGGIGVNREISKLFIVSPSILGAVDDVRAAVMKARTTLIEFPDVLFSDHTILTWLRRGRDFFNGAGGFVTTFNMSNATGPVREFWLSYSEVAALQAHALAESEKAFDFQGQAISLTRDVTDAYRTAADTLYNRLNEAVRQIKQNLARKGVQGGDGNVDSFQSKGTAKVGVLVTPISRHPPFHGRPFQNMR